MNKKSLNLHQAAGEGRIDEVITLLEAGAKVDARDGYSSTPLMYASRFGHIEVACVLVAAGADINARNSDCQTPLMIAASYGMSSVVKFLLEAGADETLFDRFGNDVIDLALITGKWEVIKTFCVLPEAERVINHE